MRTALAIVILLLAGIVQVVAPGHAEASGSPTDCQSAALQLSGAAPTGKWIPIVLVHGITGSSTDWSRPAIGSGPSVTQALRNLPGVAIYTFDYSRKSLNWVNAPELGPGLARAIDCLALASGTKVLVVAHSMGGLATQFAQAQTVDGRIVGDELAAVITIGTPTRGSQLADLINGSQLALGLAFPGAVGVLAGVLKICGILGSAHPQAEPCASASSYDTPAGRAMRSGSRELLTLPAWHAGLLVHRVATQLVVRWNLFFASRSQAIGDFVVSADSAVADGSGQPFIDTCNNVSLVDILSSPCYHGNELRDSAIIADTTKTVSVTLQSLDPASCTNEHIFASVVAAGLPAPTEIQALKCADGYGFANVLDPATPPSDPGMLFQFRDGHWTYVGSVTPPCANQFGLYGVSSATAEKIAPGASSCNGSTTSSPESSTQSAGGNGFSAQTFANWKGGHAAVTWNGDESGASSDLTNFENYVNTYESDPSGSTYYSELKTYFRSASEDLSLLIELQEPISSGTFFSTAPAVEDDPTTGFSRKYSVFALSLTPPGDRNSGASLGYPAGQPCSMQLTVTATDLSGSFSCPVASYFGHRVVASGNFEITP